MSESVGLPEAFRVNRFILTLKPLAPLHLPAFHGATLRGGFGQAFKRAVCVAPRHNCDECLLKAQCAYAVIFEASPPPGSTQLRNLADVPRPFVIEPPTGKQRDYAEGSLLSEKRMHAEPGDEIKLIPVPVLRWSAVSPVFTDLAATDDPYLAIQRQQQRRDHEALQRKRRFLDHELTDAERELLEALARTGATNARLAERLHRSPKTIANQLSQLYRKIGIHFGLDQVTKPVVTSMFADTDPP